MKNKFQFYEVVKVIDSSKPKLKEFSGEEGAVLGMAQSEHSDRWSYGVMLSSIDEIRSFYEEDLVSTSKILKRSDFYSGETVKVQVDPITGEGSLKDE